MAPTKNSPPPTVALRVSPMDSEQEAKLKAEARAYALSSSSSSKGSKRKLPSAIANSMTKSASANSTTQLSMSLNCGSHRPHKVSKIDPTSSGLNVVATPPATLHRMAQIFDDNDDDYERFVKSLGLDESLFGTFDDDEEFLLTEVDEDDEEEDDDDDETESSAGWSPDGIKRPIAMESTPILSSPLASSPISHYDPMDVDAYKSLEEELGSLLEEDMEAAVQSLMNSKKPAGAASSGESMIVSSSPRTPRATGGKKQSKAAQEIKSSSPATPLRESARQGTKTQVTYRQSQQLRRLLTSHYQLLVQQAVLAVRAAHFQKLNKDKSDFLSGETADDLAEILDGAVGMLQDLDQNRKDAIRNSIQLTPLPSWTKVGLKGRRSLLSKFKESTHDTDYEESSESDRRLTRAAFSKTLLQTGIVGMKRTAFDIPGLTKLKETFMTIDKSVEGFKGSCNVLESITHMEACKSILRQAGANIDESYIPGVNDLSENFCNAKEVFGDDFHPPCSDEQQSLLRRNRNLFTSGEDNLVLRGVNLYGEKQWILIADRYLPDRSINIISQRYSKLCVMLYRAHGIHIDSKGNLEEPPKLESVDDIDEARVRELELSIVEPPAILNVHRWSLEEDLTLLKAVPIMGHMWAELGARLIPHRDRGHLRKRYQVLERRVKATVIRSSKGDFVGFKVQRQQGTARKGDVTVAQSKLVASSRAVEKKAPARKPTTNETKATVMSIEKAAASLAFLRPAGSKEQELSNSGTVNGKHTLLSPSQPLTTGSSGMKQESKRSSPTLSVNESGSNIDGIASSRNAKLSLSLVDPSSSRVAFERLVEGTSDDWSQIARIQQMIDGNGESQGVEVVGSHLGSPVPVKLAQIDLGLNSMSGLSILQSEAAKQSSESNGPVESKEPRGSGKSIMSRILHGRNHDHDLPRQSELNSRWRTLEESPRKNVAHYSTESTIATLAPPPSTPKRTNFFSASGTPIGLSPCFRPSPGASRIGGSITLTPNPEYSPAPSTVMRLMSEPSGDELRFCDFQISEESRKGLEGEIYQVNQTHDPTPPPLTPSKNSLMLEEFDAIEAISALNSLSNSPFQAPQNSGDSDPSAPGAAKKSLFATVIGGMNSRDPKTRLKF